MIIDIILVLVLIAALFKGYSKGLVMGLFSYISLLVGLAASMKISVVVADRIGEVVKVSDQWLPFLSFIIVFIAVVIAVRWVGGLLQLSVQKLMLGWLNRLGGLLFFGLLYLTIFSVIIFYISQLGIISNVQINKSITYSYVQPLGKYAINALANIIPIFKDLFTRLQEFFEKAV